MTVKMKYKIFYLNHLETCQELDDFLATDPVIQFITQSESLTHHGKVPVITVIVWYWYEEA